MEMPIKETLFFVYLIMRKINSARIFSKALYVGTKRLPPETEKMLVNSLGSGGLIRDVIVDTANLWMHYEYVIDKIAWVSGSELIGTRERLDYDVETRTYIRSGAREPVYAY
jgi:hypothetical protein